MVVDVTLSETQPLLVRSWLKSAYKVYMSLLTMMSMLMLMLTWLLVLVLLFLLVLPSLLMMLLFGLLRLLVPWIPHVHAAC